jgi:hypothetical protein
MCDLNCAAAACCNVTSSLANQPRAMSFRRVLSYVPWFAGGYAASRAVKAGYAYKTDDEVKLQVDRASRLWMVAVSVLSFLFARAHDLPG